MSPRSLYRSARPPRVHSLVGYLAAFIFTVCTALSAAGTLSTPESAPTMPDIDVLALDDSFKAVLDARIKPIHNSQKRAEALHELLFGPNDYFIGYIGKYTFTAMETLSYGGGNCVSLANLFVAAARHVGLKAFFQEAEIEDWQEREDSGYYVLAGHVNVMVKLGARKTMTIEFFNAYIGRAAKTRLLSDNEALAQYYNNLGMDRLHEGNFTLARQYLEKGLNIDDSSPVLWSNMGIVQKRLGANGAAEEAYLAALARDGNYASAAKNLSVLYIQQNEAQKAEKYAAMVERHNRRNPYYLNKLASQALDRERYTEAIDLLKGAIKIKGDEDKFHFSLAQAYYLTGDVKRATRAMKKAKEVAENPADRQRYSGKLAVLSRMQQS